MKKMLSMLLAIALCVTVFAVQVSAEGANGNMASAEVSYNLTSSWCIEIPATIALEGSNSYISLTADYIHVLEGKAIYVDVAAESLSERVTKSAGSLVLHNTLDFEKTIDCYLTGTNGQIGKTNGYNVAKFVGEDVLTPATGGELYFMPELNATASTGKYIATLMFNIYSAAA